jgi:hypothetical protein
MQIELVGAESDRLAADLFDWLRREQVSGVRFERERAPPAPAGMGAEFLPIVTAIIAAPATAEILKAFQMWIRTRRPRVKAIVRLPDGSSIELETESLESVESGLNSITPGSAKA